jgi:putative hydrolase of the HAD superfamily
MDQAVILADADNTLWDTDAVFADAQSQLLEAIERAAGLTAPANADKRLSWLRRYDQAIATIHHRHLRYPPSLFVRALAMGIAGATPTDAASAVVRGSAMAGLTDQDVDVIVGAFFRAVERVPGILPGVREGLETAGRERIDVWVLTEGPAERQRGRIGSHGLNGLVRGVAEVTKNKEQFARYRQRFAPRIIYVIGDQPDRDIAPARAAGCRAVLVPSRFRPEWHDNAAWSQADYVSETFNAAVDWVVSDIIGNASRVVA